MSELNIPAIKIKTKYLWWAGGLLILVPLLLYIVLGLFGGAALRSVGYGGGAPAYADYSVYPTDTSAPADFYAAAPSAEFAEEALYGAMPTQIAPQGNVTNGSLVQTTERLIIREGSLSMAVEDTLASRQQIETLVSEYALQGAFVVSANEYGNGTSVPSISMTIRVPSSQFADVMNRLAAMAVQVNSRNETAADVTEEYVDLQGRLEALQTGRDRLLDIMRNADTTEALLQAEAQLTIREAEIESIQGRLQYLRGAATLSRITIDLQPHFAAQPIDTSWKPLETLRMGLDDLLDSLRDFADWLLYFAVAGLPWLVAFFLLGRWLFRAIRRRVARKAAAEPQKPAEK